MPRYRVVKPSFVNNIYHDAGPGDECNYEGEVSDNLELITTHKKPHAIPASEAEDLA